MTEIFYHLRYIITKICTNVIIATALEDKLLLALLTKFMISEMKRSFTITRNIFSNNKISNSM
jgi:hypothetical protein